MSDDVKGHWHIHVAFYVLAMQTLNTIFKQQMPTCLQENGLYTCERWRLKQPPTMDLLEMIELYTC